MTTTKEKIENIKKNGYPLDLGNVIDNAFINYKKIALYAGLAIFVFSVIMILITIIGLASFFDLKTIEKTLNPDQFKANTLTSEFYLIYLSGVVLFTIIVTPFTSGFLKMAHYADIDEEFHVSTLFSYYKAPYFMELTSTVLLLTILSTGTAFVLEYAKIPFVGSIFSIFVSFFTCLTIPLIVFGKFKALEAIKTSLLLVSKQPLAILALLIIAVVGTLVGFLGCCIGLFFTLPFSYSITYTLYKSIIGIDSEYENNEKSTEFK